MARKTGQADTIDKTIGIMIRCKRELLGMTQGELAHITGVTYQQIHKYEKGVNRISAGRLALIARGLAMPVQDFFMEPESDAGTNFFNSPEENIRNIQFSHYFQRVENPHQREAVYLLVKTMAEQAI